MNETLEYLETCAGIPFVLRRLRQRRLTWGDAKRNVRERMEKEECRPKNS